MLSDLCRGVEIVAQTVGKGEVCLVQSQPTCSLLVSELQPLGDNLCNNWATSTPYVLLSSVTLKTFCPTSRELKLDWYTYFWYPLKVKSPFLIFPLTRSLVEDDDAHMKVALGYGDMGISAHLQASKTGNTRFFTSNTHSSVVLQVRVYTHIQRSWIIS